MSSSACFHLIWTLAFVRDVVTVFVKNNHGDLLRCIISILFVMHALSLKNKLSPYKITKVCLGVCSQKQYRSPLLTLIFTCVCNYANI